MISNNKPVFISGFKNSGKDTVANYLVDTQNYRKDSFAASLKDVTSVLFGWDRAMLEGDTPESRAQREIPDEWWTDRLNINDLSPRYALQLIGTEALRNNFHNDIWVASVEKRILDNDKPTVLSDCRFQNELLLCDKLGGSTVCVMRGDYPEWWDTAIEANMGSDKAIRILADLEIHASEYSWIGFPFDYVIENNGTIDDLYSKIQEIFS